MVTFTVMYDAFEKLGLIKNKEDLRRAIEKRSYELKPEIIGGKVVEYLEDSAAIELKKYLKKRQGAERNFRRRGPHSCSSLEGKVNEKT